MCAHLRLGLLHILFALKQQKLLELCAKGIQELQAIQKSVLE